jgi:hypothetical protein
MDSSDCGVPKPVFYHGNLREAVRLLVSLTESLNVVFPLVHLPFFTMPLLVKDWLAPLHIRIQWRYVCNLDRLVWDKSIS